MNRLTVLFLACTLAAVVLFAPPAATAQPMPISFWLLAREQALIAARVAAGPVVVAGVEAESLCTSVAPALLDVEPAVVVTNRLTGERFLYLRAETTPPLLLAENPLCQVCP